MSVCFCLPLLPSPTHAYFLILWMPCSWIIFNPIWIRLTKLNVRYWMWFRKHSYIFRFFTKGSFFDCDYGKKQLLQCTYNSSNITKFEVLQTLGITSPWKASPTHVLTGSFLSSCLQEIPAFLLSSFPPSLLPSFTPSSDISYLQSLKSPQILVNSHGLLSPLVDCLMPRYLFGSLVTIPHLLFLATAALAFLYCSPNRTK